MYFLCLHWWVCANVVFVHLRKMCPKCCVDSSVSFGEKINYYMHNIYISITNTNLEAIKFIELTSCVFYCLNSLSLYCRLLAAVQHSSLWGFWLQSGERSTEAVRTTVFSKSTFILSYYDMVSSPWKLQWNLFSRRRIHWRWCSTSCLRSRDFKELLFVYAVVDLWLWGLRVRKRIHPTPSFQR